MATIYLRGERFYVDDDMVEEIEALTWSASREKGVKHVYREGGKVKAKSLADLVMRQKAGRGHIWIHLDDSWRNFQRENLRLAPRGSWLYRSEGGLSPERRKEGALKGSRVAASNRLVVKPPEDDVVQGCTACRQQVQSYAEGGVPRPLWDEGGGRPRLRRRPSGSGVGGSEFSLKVDLEMNSMQT